MASNNAPRTSWADMADSPPSQEAVSSPPPSAGLEHSSQMSTLPQDPSQLFPATPNSFDGSQPQSQQTGLTQDFAAAVSVVSASQQPASGDASESSAEKPMWSPHRLRRSAETIENRNTNRQKRSGGQSPKHAPAEKKHRAGTGSSAAASSVIGVTAADVQPGQPSASSSATMLPSATATAPLSPAPAADPSPEPEPTSAGAGEADDDERAPVSEEDRERRIRKRTTGINSVRRSPEYCFLVELWNSGRVVLPPAARHDPSDVINVSKRTWERGMEEWRHDIRRLAFENGFRGLPPAA